MRYHGTNSDGETLSSMYVEKLDSNPAFTLDCSNLPSLTRQEFAEEADINSLMSRYEATGLIPSNLNQATPQFLDVSSVPDMQTALDTLSNATTAFMALPATVRREFDNDPLKFVNFAQDPENLPQMRTWGLAPPEKTPDPIPVVRVEGYEPAASDAPASDAAGSSKSKK